MDKQFLQRLLTTFKAEASEHLKSISDVLIKLENSSSGEGRASLVETVYREAHSLKGAARAVNLKEVEFVCQRMENVFASLKKGELIPTDEVFDMLHRSVDSMGAFLAADTDSEKNELASELEQLAGILEQTLVKMLQTTQTKHIKTPLPNAGSITEATTSPDNNDAAETEPEPAISSEEIEKIKARFFIAPAEAETVEFETDQLPPIAAPRKKKTAKSQQADSFRIASLKLDKLYLLSEEMMASRINFNHLSEGLQSMLFSLYTWKREWRKHSSYLKMIRSRAEKKHAMPEQQSRFEPEKLIEFLDWNYDFMERIDKQIRSLTKFTFQNTKQLGSQLDQLTDDLKEIMILPFADLLDMFPKLTYDLAKDLGKLVEFISDGNELEVDKRILEELKDPLIHIVRNAIDHGIEKPEIRAKKGKPAKGKITLRILQIENNQVEIQIEDDGNGIDVEKIIQSSSAKGLLSAKEIAGLNEQDKLQLLFRSGISTSQVITDISGRGLGMAIVKEKIDKLDGSIRIENSPGKGAKFYISLPLTIAAMRGIKIRCGEHNYIIPTTKADKVMRIAKNSVKTIENRKTILINNIPVILADLIEILEQAQPQERQDTYYTIILLSSHEFRAAFIVDAILDESEIVIKPFNRQIQKVKNIAGSTILGDGRVIPILNTHDLVLSAIKHNYTQKVERKSTANISEKRILVVDDSITSRMLVKDILESTGYKVKTAIDGLDAITLIRSNKFNLVVSDVEMPRMNGFELTAQIRKDTANLDLPVVLVTGLSKREDREKGIEAGANAYIVKSSFDQSILLDTIQRLIV